MRLFKPRGRGARTPAFPDEIVDDRLQRRICCHRLEPRARHGLQHEPRVVGQRPEFRIESPPDGIGRMIERPAQIQRQFREGVGAERLREASGIGRVAHRRERARLLLAAVRDSAGVAADGNRAATASRESPVSLEPSLAQVLAQQLHHPAVGRHMIIGCQDLGRPFAIGNVEQRR